MWRVRKAVAVQARPHATKPARTPGSSACPRPAWSEGPRAYYGPEGGGGGVTEYVGTGRAKAKAKKSKKEGAKSPKRGAKSPQKR